MLLLGVAASVGANILHADPHLVSQLIAAWPPLALLLTVELISRIPVYRRGLATIRVLSTIAIAGIAAWVSYGHIADVAARYGETGIVPYLLPLSVDGLVVVASVCLVEIAAHRNRLTSAWSGPDEHPPTAPAAPWPPPAPWPPGDRGQAEAPLPPYHAGEMLHVAPDPPAGASELDGERAAIPATAQHDPLHARDEHPDRKPAGASSNDPQAPATTAGHVSPGGAETAINDAGGPATAATPDADPTPVVEPRRQQDPAGRRARTPSPRTPPAIEDDTDDDDSTDMRAAVAHWRRTDPTLRQVDVAAKLNCSRRTVARYWNSTAAAPDAATPAPDRHDASPAPRDGPKPEA